MRLSIFGTGSWGLTLAGLAHRSGAEVMLYARRPELAETLTRKRRHPTLLPHLKLGESVRVTADLAEAARFSPYWLLVPPSQHMRALAEYLVPYVANHTHVISASKGLEETTHLRMTQVLHDVWQWTGHMPSIGALSGPNLSWDVSRGQPAASVLATSANDFALFAELLGQSNLRLYRQSDLIGVELGGALKNILALAVGMAQGLELGDSAKATIVTRGLHEMGRLAVTLGANWMTLAGLAGLGDLVATASSLHSRNRWCGEELARGRDLTEIVQSTSMVVEGVPAAWAASELGQIHDLSMPITCEVVAIFQGKSARQALSDLMARALVDEFW